MGTVRLTITARDPEHARRILEALERLEGGGDEILVTPTGEPPTGHTYRELCDARRDGRLEATMTPRGLVFTTGALERYRKLRDQRRARKRRPGDSPNVEDLNAHRIAALENAGLRRRDRRG